MQASLFDERSLLEITLERFRAFERPEGYLLGFSGGKDSTVLLDTAKRSGVKFEAFYNVTSCDPPEVIQFVKSTPGVKFNHPGITMWDLVRREGMPPLRHIRFCCRTLKEVVPPPLDAGTRRHYRTVLTGVRWGESPRRQRRQMVETCLRRKSQTYLHPLIDWTTADIWAYIRTNNLPYCRLYDEGRTRVGCVLCPMTRDVHEQMARWPRLARAWERTVKAVYRPEFAETYGCRDPESFWQWWLSRDRRLTADDDDCVLFEDQP